jgi:hypothetical protein
MFMESNDYLEELDAWLPKRIRCRRHALNRGSVHGESSTQIGDRCFCKGVEGFYIENLYGALRLPVSR